MSPVQKVSPILPSNNSGSQIVVIEDEELYKPEDKNKQFISAIKNLEVQTVKRLIAEGIDINFITPEKKRFSVRIGSAVGEGFNIYNYTPLDYALEQKRVLTVEKDKRAINQIIKMLKENGAKENKQKQEFTKAAPLSAY